MTIEFQNRLTNGFLNALNYTKEQYFTNVGVFSVTVYNRHWFTVYKMYKIYIIEMFIYFFNSLTMISSGAALIFYSATFFKRDQNQTSQIVITSHTYMYE